MEERQRKSTYRKTEQGETEIEGKKQTRFRKRQIGRVREFNERIPTDRRNKPTSSADQIEVGAAGCAPLLAEEEERSWCSVL